MATPETKIKQKLNRRDDKLTKLSELHHERLTFGPFSKSGLPDRLTFWGTAAFAVEVKADEKELTKLQLKRLKEAAAYGIPGIGVIGNEGVDSYYKAMLPYFTEEAVEERMIQYERDCLALREVLEGLIDE